MLMWTVEACVNVNKVSKVIISTDSEEYWQTVRSFCDSKKLELDLRTPEQAGDEVKIFDYLKAEREKLFSQKEEKFVLALPTVPLRTDRQIDEAIELFEIGEFPVFSASEYHFPLSFAFAVEGATVKPLLTDSPLVTGNTRSQEQKAFFHPNGAIYVRSSLDLKNEELKSLYQNAQPYFMDRKTSIDVDNELDLIIARGLIRRTTW